jgi:hypothetical protein
MSPSETIICPFCAETIKAAAKVCPFCQSKQGRFAFWRQKFLGVIPVIFFVIAAIVILAWFAPESNHPGGRNFTWHRSDLVVMNTSLERNGARPDFWLTGVVTNQGKFPWRVCQFEVRFLDERSNLLDVYHPDAEGSFVVGSCQESGFRVKLGRPAFTNNSITRQVRVQLAIDGDRPLKQD